MRPVMSAWRPRWRPLPAWARAVLAATAGLVTFPPLWRAYAWWWDIWNGAGAFCERWLPAVR